MALVIRNIVYYYDHLFNKSSDPRTEHLPLVGSPLPVVGVITLYLFFVNKWGPKFMVNRKAFDLQNIMIVFNLVQILGNLYIMIFVSTQSYLGFPSVINRFISSPAQGFRYSYAQKYFSIKCQPLDYEASEPKMKLVYITYMYFLLKLIDLLDTVFFVLRKKTNQISFLHIYHHSGMVFGTYISCKFLTGSHATMLGLINSWVHVVMYTYYFLTAFKPELKQSFWWKKHITQIQLVNA